MMGGLVGGSCGKVWPGRGLWSARIAIEVRIIVIIFRVFLECSFICLFEVLLARIGASSRHCVRGRFEKMKRGLRGGSEKVLEGWLSVRMKEYEHERSDKVNLQTM